jgi:hypothetical protein
MKKKKLKKNIAKANKKAVKKGKVKVKAKKKAVKKKLVKTGKKSLKPARSSEARAAEVESALQTLLLKGSGRGFVTEAEILHVLPNLEDDIASVEEVMKELEKRGIEIVDQEVASIWEQSKQQQESKAKVTR